MCRKQRDISERVRFPVKPGGRAGVIRTEVRFPNLARGGVKATKKIRAAGMLEHKRAFEIVVGGRWSEGNVQFFRTCNIKGRCGCFEGDPISGSSRRLKVQA